jgi:hypothetical protein
LSSKPVDLRDTENWQPALLQSLRNCGVQRDAVSARRRVLFWLALVCTANFVVFVPDLINTIGYGQDVQSLLTLLYWLFVIPPTLFFLTRLKEQLERMKARSAVKALESPKARRPTFYLRSFDLDERIAEPTLIQNFYPLPNAEQKVATHLGKLGPLITIGRPGEKLPALGAARFYVSDELWQAKVADVVRASQLVLWATGVSEGLRWEISHLIASLPPEKLVVWAHPHVLRAGAAEREAEWRRFLEAVGGVFPKPLPQSLGDTRFICFAPDWTPIPIAPPWRGPIEALWSLFSPLGSALRAVRRIKKANLDPRRAAYRHARRDIRESDFANLIGVGEEAIRWPNMIVFAVAELAAAVSLYLGFFAREAIHIVSLYGFSAIPDRHSGTLQYFHLSVVLRDILLSVIESACAIIAFRKVRNERWAAIIAAAAYTALSFVVVFSSGEHTSNRLIFVPWRVQTFLYVSAELLGLVYAVKRYRPLAKALWIGEFGGTVVAWLATAVVTIVLRLFLSDSGLELRYLGIDIDSFLALILSSLVFATVFWAGTRLTGTFDDQTPELTRGAR